MPNPPSVTNQHANRPLSVFGIAALATVTLSFAAGAAPVVVEPTPLCSPDICDYDASGVSDIFDVFTFLNDAAADHPSADIAMPLGLDAADVSELLTALQSPTCL